MNGLRRYFGLMVCLVLAGSLLGCAGDRSFGQRIDDQTIETKVKTALVGAPDVSGSAISVEVRDGDVQLSGFVKSQAEAQRAIDLARRVEGVRKVINKMTVRS